MRRKFQPTLDGLERRTLLSGVGGRAAEVAPRALALSAGLSAASDPLGNGVVFAPRVEIQGQTAPGAVARIGSGPGATRVAADGQGTFRAIVGVPYGSSTVKVSARDGSGGVATTEVAVTRGNAVLAWNAAALQAIRLAKTSPPIAAHHLAIAQVAVENAALATSRSGMAAACAAVAGAARDSLVALFPAQSGILDAAFSASLAGLNGLAGVQSGLAKGRSAAAAALAARAHDGSAEVVAYTPTPTAGHWRPTPPAFASALLPGWGEVTPFALARGDQFRPAPPPALDSAEYAAALAEVEAIGSKDSATRTADQTEIAKFWADGAGTETPPGHWNRIAADVSLQRRTSLLQDARIFSQLNQALADAGIACWDVKYAADLWRPITAIRATSDPSWTPLLTTPPFPSYVSGHSTFSAAAATVLSAAFGANTRFTTTSDGLPGVSRSFSSFTGAANEAGLSRIYGGIHYAFDNTTGLALGHRIGQYVLARA